MKKYKAEAPKKNIKFNTNKQPDIRDNLDSRKNQEQDFKGNNVTQNLKDKQNRSNKHKH